MNEEACCSYDFHSILVSWCSERAASIFDVKSEVSSVLDVEQAGFKRSDLVLEEE